jgi:hypothetical protein
VRIRRVVGLRSDEIVARERLEAAVGQAARDENATQDS